MSRTRRKMIREGICKGSNTSFYRDRRHRQRRINNQRLKAAVNSSSLKDLDDIEYLEIPKEDSWLEPTDGTHLIDKADLGYYYTTNSHRYKKMNDTLKPKHHR